MMIKKRALRIRALRTALRGLREVRGDTTEDAKIIVQMLREEHLLLEGELFMQGYPPPVQTLLRLQRKVQESLTSSVQLCLLWFRR